MVKIGNMHGTKFVKARCSHGQVTQSNIMSDQNSVDAILSPAQRHVLIKNPKKPSEVNIIFIYR